MLAAALLMMSGAACSTPRVDHAAIDPLVLADCPRSVESPGELPTGAQITLPDGTLAVPQAVAVARETMLTRGLLAFRSAWTQCRSAVIYVEERQAALDE